MNNRVIKVYKKEGQTPLDCINILKKEDPDLKFVPMTYAGRLDPLAEGVLLVLTGYECHKKDEYLSLPKEYEVDVLFGFKTDTYDVMGLVIEAKDLFKNDTLLEKKRFESFTDYVSGVQKIIPEFIGRIKQSYPPYSSRTVNGKPLFQWAREERLDEIEIPTHDVFVESIDILSQSKINGEKLLFEITEKISKVVGDFRQKEIISKWREELTDKKITEFLIIKLKISCGSGVYVRGVAHEIGEKLGVPSLSLKIVRTKVGEYKIN